MSRIGPWLIRHLHRNPYVAYKLLRRFAPVLALADGRVLVVSGRQQAAAILSDPETFSSSVMRGADPHLLGADPPAHTRVRRIVSHAISGARLAQATNRAHAVAAEFRQRLALGGQVDVIASLAVPLPLAVVADLLGIPPSECSRLGAWADAVVSESSSLPGSPPAETHGEGRVELERFVSALVELRVGAPGPDALSAMLAGESGERLTIEEARSVVKLLIIAGSQTTTHCIGNAVLALVSSASKGAVPPSVSDAARVVEEALRFDPPAQFVVRRVTRDASVNGRHCPAGAITFVMLGAMGGNADCLPGARFDPRAGVSAHMAFGIGPHACLGASLARVEARIALEPVLEWLPKLRVARRPDAVVRSAAFQLRALRHLWVETCGSRGSAASGQSPVRGGPHPALDASRPFSSHSTSVERPAAETSRAGPKAAQ